MVSNIEIPVGLNFAEIAPSAADKVCAALGVRSAGNVEEIIKCVLDESLGEGQWTIECLKGRVSAQTSPGSPATIYFLDGKPLLEIHAPEIKTVNDTKGLRMVATVKWRKLYL